MNTDMAFDNPTRNRLASFVATCRNLLSDEFTGQLKRDYGLDPDSGVVTDIEKLTQLDDAHLETARILRDTLQHYVAGSTSEPKKSRQEAMKRIVREQAFTVLNRLCALRMAEARKLFVESVGNGLQSQGFQLYARLAGTALGESGDAYRCYLFSVFDELAVDLAVLFNRFSPEGRLFPPGTVLQEILTKLNAPEIIPLWAEDETIGWIYQYFNDPAERKKMRDESAAPRNSRELAVRNQFFTPRYVVEFLTDNTLGRIWYEMTQGQTSLKDTCRYMVRRPDEVFLGSDSVGWAFLPVLPSSAPSNETPTPTPKSKGKSPKAAEEKSSLGIPARAPHLPSTSRKAGSNEEKVEEKTGKNAHPTNEEELVPEFSAATDDHIQRMIDLAHCVDGDVRHPDGDQSGAWLQELRRQHLDSMQYDGVATQDLLDALFVTCRSDRHGGDGTVYKERWFAAACNEVRRRVLNSRRTDLSQEELLKQPVFIPYRAMKDPREIRMLDPACGSMHFGLYAFDLFEVIYKESPTSTMGIPARPNTDSDRTMGIPARRETVGQESTMGIPARRPPSSDDLPSCAETVGQESTMGIPARRPPSSDDLPSSAETDGQECPSYMDQSQIPKLIIEHNIHGIDIDRRAVQIAGLSLWLRAQKSWQKQKVKPQDRPRIVRSNIVCAEPMPGNSELLEEFLQKHLSSDAEGHLLTVLVRKVFEAMKLAGEAGSLLKIEEEIAGEVEKARQLWEKSREKKQQSLFDNRPKQVQQEMDFLRRIDDATFWDEAENLIYTALRAYAEQAENGGGFQRRLFAEDAARGFAFIDVCRKRYDVVAMNPPFGEWSAMYKAETRSNYPYSHNDILGAFVERGGLLLHAAGRLGAITSRTCFFLSSFTKWRDRVVLDLFEPELLVDLGHGVMDAAMVEAATYVLAKSMSRFRLHSNMHCFRMLNEDDPAGPLATSVAMLHEGMSSENTYTVDPESFRQIPNAPFAYWVSERIRRLFAQLPAFEGDERNVKQGLATADDFRFVRTAWETHSIADRDPARIWFPFAKGGSYSPFYSDVFLQVNWGKRGAEIKNNLTETGSVRSNVWMLRDTEILYFLRPGLTWPRRTNGLSFRALPAGSIFADKGPVAFATDNSTQTLLGLLAVTNSQPFGVLISVQLARVELAQSFEVGLVQNTPIPVEESPVLACLALSAWSAKRLPDTASLTSHAFFGPPLARRHSSLAGGSAVWSAQLAEAASILANLRRQIDDIVYRLYGIDNDDRHAIELIIGGSRSGTPAVPSTAATTDEEVEDSVDATSDSNSAHVAELLDYGCGIAFGRWNIRYATGEQAAPELPDPFAPLPVCPPGQLQNAQGLPARPEDVPEDYPIQIPWDGILVDDPGHALDIERRVREVIEIIWGEKAAGCGLQVAREGKKFEAAVAETGVAAADSCAATPEAIEQEACEILGVRSLREYFQKPAKFFADHLKRYSKSRRQAPIYWPLSTESSGYTLWIYYHRLTDQTLFHAVNNFVEPKLKQVTEDVTRLKAKAGRSSAEEKELSKLTELASELTDFRDELLLVARFWKPNLNDGVLITASPLWKLFRLPKWRKDLKACWEELEKGDYDWAHLALSIWPDRVVRTAHKDRSIAIAHDLETTLWHEATVTKTGRGKNAKVTTKTEWQPKKLTEGELDKIVKEQK